VDIKQQVAQGRGKVIVGDREQFLPQDQVKPCEVRMSLMCNFLRKEALHTVWCRKWPLESQRKWEDHIKTTCRVVSVGCR
jgi:hypothetical protein